MMASLGKVVIVVPTRMLAKVEHRVLGRRDKPDLPGGRNNPSVVEASSTAGKQRRRGRRPLLGLRRQPGRLVLAAMRLPRPLYHRGWGWMLGHTFLLIAHQGRKTGSRRETVAMALAYDPAAREVVVCSAWGPATEWIRNLRAGPALEIRIGRESYVPEQRFLSEDESVAVVREFQHCHPWRTRLFTVILGWGDVGSDAAVREFVRSRPFVAFRPMRAAGT